MTKPPYAGDITAKAAWDILAQDPRAALIDVRTTAEWNYVGVPDLGPLGKKALFVPWVEFPAMQPNPGFAQVVASAVPDREAPLLFLCRSGARSRAAAVTMTAGGYATCYNIIAGFEGDHDAARHRGTVAGWKVEGLPWVQG